MEGHRGIVDTRARVVSPSHHLSKGSHVALERRGKRLDLRGTSHVRAFVEKEHSLGPSGEE